MRVRVWMRLDPLAVFLPSYPLPAGKARIISLSRIGFLVILRAEARVHWALPSGSPVRLASPLKLRRWVDGMGWVIILTDVSK